MKQGYTWLLTAAIVTGTAFSCNQTKKENRILDQTNFTAPPVAQTKTDTFINFGKQRTDDYFWMKDKSDEKVLNYIKAENAYTETVMAGTKDLQKKLYDEFLGRIKEDDESYPVKRKGYYYYSRREKGKQYRTYCRRKETMEAPEEVIFDVNKMAEGKNAYIFGSYSISPDNQKAAYFFNETGSFADFEMRIKDLQTGEDTGFSVKGAASMAWANDNKTIFYSKIDNQTLRSYQIYRQTPGANDAKLIYEEKDPKFSAYVHGEITRQYVMISINSSTTSEIRLLPADDANGDFKVFMPRVQDVEYSVIPHENMFLLTYKDKENFNGMIYRLPKEGYENRDTWKVFTAHNEEVRLDGIDVLKNYVVLNLRKNGLNETHIKDLDGKEVKKISFPEPVYTAYSTAAGDFDINQIRYSYTSLNRPTTLYEYDIVTDKTVKLKEQEIPSGFNPENYVVERLWATAGDGTNVPMAIIYKKGLKKDGSASALLYSYGSYGSTSDVYFNSTVFSLVDRGFVFGIAQIRGGSDMGEKWYEDGKLLKKKNTFTDFIACSEKLIADKYTSAGKLAAMGGSAGGLLMGAVANMRPDLYQTIVAQVPFVDVINTMLDDTLPLTTGEYEEWGNPNEEEYYNYMLSYSPYDNIERKEYPNMLVTGGLNDSQVLFHEPTKYVAKLRANKTDNNILLLHMNMESGHGGATGSYDRLKDTAFEYAFILNRVGINE